MSHNRLPHIVAAADWSTHPRKRRLAVARLEGARYTVEATGAVEDGLIERLGRMAGPAGTALVGFDFPIGLPFSYARRQGLTTFRLALPLFGCPGDWQSFYEVSDSPASRRPFFPRTCRVGTGARQRHAEALGESEFASLLRRCDRRTARRQAAGALFFTLGPRQVGRAAIHGWRHVLAPSLDQIRLWPFDGELADLVAEPGLVVAEIYPAEAYTHLGITFGFGKGKGKTDRSARRTAARAWIARSAEMPIKFSTKLRCQMAEGCESDDDFDAVAGLLSMLLVVTGSVSATAPTTAEVRTIEGWILGQPVEEQM